MNQKSVSQKSLSLNYQRFTPPGRKVRETRRFEFVAKTQFLFKKQWNNGKKVTNTPSLDQNFQNFSCEM